MCVDITENDIYHIYIYILYIVIFIVHIIHKLRAFFSCSAPRFLNQRGFGK